MDFGNILDNWEKSEKKKSKQTKSTGQEWRNKKLQPDSVAVTQKSLNKDDENIKGKVKKTLIDPRQQMNAWLRMYGVQDKDKVIQEQEEAEKQLDRSYLRVMPSEARIDLHGLTQKEASIRLDAFITECVRRDLQKVLIIHGKGNHSDDEPVLSGMVRNFIERDYRLGEFGHPGKEEGGKGATWVLIHKKKNL